MQINNSTVLNQYFANTSHKLFADTTRKLFESTSNENGQHLKGKLNFIIFDQLTISEEGLDLYKSSKEEDEIDLNNIIELSDNPYFLLRRSSKDQTVHNMFIDTALDYKEKLELINNSMEDMEIEMSVNQLNNDYSMNLENSINEIADSFDHYFDRGRMLSDVFSEFPANDLFDKEAFKDSLRTSVLEIKDYIVNTTEPLVAEEIDNRLMNQEETTALEKMSYSDMKVLYKYINEPVEYVGESNRDDDVTGEMIASKERAAIRKIETLNLSTQVKESMNIVNSRVSSGELKQLAFKKEKSTFIEEMKEADLLLQKLMERLYKISLRIQSISDNNGISPKNKTLLKYLNRSQALTNQYNELKQSKADKEKEFSYLDKNKHTIVETDTYKKIKADYDNEMNTELEEK